ncbi:Vmc-like lipoprotein signal peptide domain-containing protein [Williamsoniiplasma lucivorax]|uniref:Uncharacterized protein n=1 Tax=Williamsoniiplasma lucivorax TaxID=209274 RepID=A0A2S5RCV4_9MOLU|nr:hypothetical protein [Williamsoniiplasma lucivorax]PPE05140.1 hypothetical protein ELUCI_v1c06760 [Williamsoniiplasma lucivorax]
MKKLIGLLASLFVMSGTVTTVVACGTYIEKESIENDISNIIMEAVIVDTNFDEIKAQIASEIASETNAQARLGIDYKINGNTDQPGKIVVQATPESNLITGSFNIAVVQPVDLGSITISDIRVGDSKVRVYQKIDELLHYFSDGHDIYWNYEILGLDNLVEGANIAYAGSVHVIPAGPYLTGGFVLWIDHIGSKVEVLDAQANPPVKLQDISQVTVADIQIGETLESIKSKIHQPIQNLWPDTPLVFDQDYEIKGLETLVEENKLIHQGSIHVVGKGRYITGGFVLIIRQTGSTTEVLTPETTPPTKLADISQVQINDLQIGDTVEEMDDKIYQQIQKLLPNTLLSSKQDYEILGLAALVEENKLVHEGSVHVIAKGNKLTGGFVLWIRQTSSSTEVLANNAGKPTKLQDISQVQIKVNRKMSSKELHERIQKKIDQVISNTQIDIDYQIEGTPENSEQIIVRASNTSKLIKGQFVITVSR